MTNFATVPKLLVATGFWPSISNSISGIFVVQQVAALARQGLRVTVLTARAFGRTTSRLLSPSELGLPTDAVNLIDVSVARLPEKLAKFPGCLAANAYFLGDRLAVQIRKMIREGDVFKGCIVHGARYMGLSLPYWRALIDGSVVFVLHGVDPVLADQRVARRLKPAFRRAVNAVEKVVVVGRPLIPHALSLGVPKRKVDVVLNGCELPERSTVTPYQHEKGNVRRVVSVSNLVEWKGIDLNLRALAKLRDRRPDLAWEYRIVGDGPERGCLHALAERLGLTRQVNFLGRITYEDTMREMAEADVFSLPSWGEAFGIVYLEAMAQMRPVIGCLSNGPADFITQEREGVLVTPHEVDELSNALERLIDNPELCRRMGIRGRATAEGLSWDVNAKRMLELCGIRLAVGSMSTN